MIICSLIFLALLLFCPETAMAGSKYGATLWLTQLLPTLLPFFIAIRLLNTCLPQATSKRPFLLIGLLCGYPAGAALVTEQYDRGLLKTSQAYFYLGFVNNPSPMFILVFCGNSILGLSSAGSFLLFAILIVSSLAGSLLFLLLNRNHSSKQDSFAVRTVCPDQSNTASLSAKLDDIILDSFIIMAKIGGYVIIFSILGQFINQILPANSLSSILCAGSLEITSGVSYLKAASLSLYTKKVLIMVILSFGGLSAAAQTGSILTKSELSLFPYIMNKGLNSLIAGLFSLLLFRIL